MSFRREVHSSNCPFHKVSVDKVSVRQNVGVPSDKAFVNQFQNLFIGLNENGQVVTWHLTKTTAFEQIEDLLHEFKCRLDAQSTTLEMIIVDRKPSPLRKMLAREFGLIFCQNGDTGGKRTKNMPCVEDIQ